MLLFEMKLLVQLIFPGLALALLPWVVTEVSSHSPSPIQGNAPFCSFRASIQDPNFIDVVSNVSNVTRPAAYFMPSNTTCQAEWYCMHDPYDVVHPCSRDENGFWMFKMVRAANTTPDYRPSPTTNFDLLFTRVATVGLSYRDMQIKQFEGKGHFEVGQNMRGVCGGRGQCSWWLKENTTALVEQKEVECSDWC
jgi:hypothetical protein